MAIKFKSATWQTYRELCPVCAGSVEEMVAGLAFHISLEAKTVEKLRVCGEAVLDATDHGVTYENPVQLHCQRQCKGRRFSCRISLTCWRPRC